MTRAISFSIWDKVKEKLTQLKEEAKRREQITNTRIEAKALEGTEFKALPEGSEPLQLPFGDLCFDSEGRAFDQIPAGLLLNRKIEEFKNDLSMEQLAMLDLVDQAAEVKGFEMEIEKIISPSPEKPVVHALLRAGRNFPEVIESGFEDQKALPPVSTEFSPLSKLFRDRPEKEIRERGERRKTSDGSKRT